MILYIENPKDSTKIWLELINEFSKVTDYKSMYRNLLCFYNEAAEREIKVLTFIVTHTHTHTHTHTQDIRCQGINLTKET